MLLTSLPNLGRVPVTPLLFVMILVPFPLYFKCCFKLQQYFVPQGREISLYPLSTILSQCNLQHQGQYSLYFCVFLYLTIFYVFFIFVCRSCSVSHQLFFRGNCSINLVCRFCVSIAKVNSESSYITIFIQTHKQNLLFSFFIILF